MKFATKLVLYVIVIIAIILSVSRYFVVMQNFMHSIDSTAKQNMSKYTLERYMLESNIIKNIQIGEKITDNEIIEYVKEMHTYTKNSLEKIAIYSENADEIFSDFENIKSEDIIEILNQDTDNYYIKIIDNRKYMIFPSYWAINNEGRYIINAYDITGIFIERDRQLYEILLVDIIILLISTILITIVSVFLTKPIKKLNEISKKITAGEFTERIYVNSKDEIGELAESFNIMAEEIENKIKELNLSIKQKEDFITGFTHEIKNPMTTIVGYADLLRLRKCDEEVNKKALNYIYRETKRLEKLSYKLMQLMSISDENIRFENIQIAELIDKVIKTEKEFETIKIDSNIQGAQIKCDCELIEIVLRNVIDNAKKAKTKDNRILVVGKNLENGKYKVSVIDRGIGISTEHIQRVTESFYVVDKSRAKINGGSGIGLALCKKILEVHKTKLEIESKEGEGTIVSFELEVV